jgi:arylsulfatase A-like enzyme
MIKPKSLEIIGTALCAMPIVALNATGQNKSVPTQQRPNIVIILADDMGYSDIGCYGSEIHTPNLDALAANGVRWAQFYNNARSCPSRAVLMTGLYPHQAGMGWMAAADLQLPQYEGYINHNCVTIAEVLRSAGYGTYMSGKWHLSSDRQNEGSVIERWPNARGFERFYGIPSGASNYFNTTMYNDGVPEKTTDGFYITGALSDSASAFITRHNYKEKPLFLYMAFNAPHWPLHALQKDMDKYKDVYNQGWDKIRAERFAKQKELGIFAKDVEMSPRDSQVDAWDSLTPAQQEDFAKRMTIYAAQIDALDQGVGKIVKALKDAGQFDNTVIMFMSDNGACAEHVSSGKSKEVTGKEDTFESYRINWANASSTPYREYKHYTNEGGIATPLVVSWPDGIDRKYNGTIVRQYGYFADIMATCVDLSGAQYPTTYEGNTIIPMEGYSLVPNFNGKQVKRGETFWEHEANLAVRDGKWKFVIKTREGAPYDSTKCELYDMSKDPTELHNLAVSYPERTQKMFSDWKAWSRRVKAYPLDTRGYGERQQAFRRVINGEFVDNFGGWVQDCSAPAQVTFSIDRNGVMSGANCARIDVAAKGERPANAFLKWQFPTMMEDVAGIGFTYRSDKANSLVLRLESVNNPQEKQFSKTLDLHAEGGTYYFDNIDLPDKGRYQLVLYFGQTEPGTVWVDGVKLDLKNENNEIFKQNDKRK